MVDYIQSWRMGIAGGPQSYILHKRQLWVESYNDFGSHLGFSTTQKRISDVVIYSLNMSCLLSREKSQIVPPWLKQNNDLGLKCENHYFR